MPELIEDEFQEEREHYLREIDLLKAELSAVKMMNSMKTSLISRLKAKTL